jgi:hypothetical protein
MDCFEAYTMGFGWWLLCHRRYPSRVGSTQRLDPHTMYGMKVVVVLRSLTACGCIMVGRAVQVWLGGLVAGGSAASACKQPSSAHSRCMV